MSISRRTLLKSSAALTAIASLPPALVAAEGSGLAPVSLEPAATATPPVEVIALNRMAYGPRLGDLERVRMIGLEAYVDEQLAPANIGDSDCDARIAAARLKISYAAGTDNMGLPTYPAKNEAAPLTTLDQLLPQLWQERYRGGAIAGAERSRPFEEVRVATWLRAVYSQRQLQEVLVEFWHNHFNVNATSSQVIYTTFPAYDRIMRSNCLGNFRVFLEEVAKSTAMLYYLDNVSNKFGSGQGGNENFARELFELHTLGSDNYLKFYDDRTKIGTNEDAAVRGYIDDDIYEAARCLTGWTVSNGHWERSDGDTGQFYYDPNWHDTAPKTVLSPNGIPNMPRDQADMRDAQDVFDLLARHRGTARNLCKKLCWRLIADEPPQSVIDAAVAVWMANIDAPDQIKQVVRTILLSNEFKATWGQKMKRPFEFVVSYLRATGAELQNDTSDPTDASNIIGHWGDLFWRMGGTGHRIFEWGPPTGYPDVASYWANTNGMLQRWSLPYMLTQSWGGGAVIDLMGQTEAAASCTQIVDYWIGRLCGFSIDAHVREELITFLAQGGDVDEPPKPLTKSPDYGNVSALTDRLNGMVQLLTMCPDFHTR